MSFALVLVAPDRPAYPPALYALGELALERGVPPPAVLSPWEAAEWAYPAVDPALVLEALGMAEQYGVDVAIVPTINRRKRLLVADMDSTIIGCECIDELADFAGKKAEIAAITERAMAGELDFEGALTARVAMLAGLPLSALAACFDDRVRLNPGAEVLVRTMASHGARCVLASGGFRFFTERVAQLAGFHSDHANQLDDDRAVLTGTVTPPIFGRAGKLAVLEAEAQALGLTAADALAIGDGANDLAMIEAAGLGIAYRAKPVVAAAARASIHRTSLETALFYQGYRRAEFWRG